MEDLSASTIFPKIEFTKEFTDLTNNQIPETEKIKYNKPLIRAGIGVGINFILIK